MSSPQVTRMSGAGNTFFIWNSTRFPIPKESRSGLVRFLCDGFTNFYTDGMVFIEASRQEGLDFQWDFYNADGSSAEMCGNAARCAALYFKERMSGSENPIFLTAAGKIHAHVLNDQIVEVRMPGLSSMGGPQAFGAQKEEHFFVNTGVPHVVVEGEPSEEVAKKLRRASELGPAGANVTFFNEISPGEVEAITFERGVENFTLSCGTGAVAAAALSIFKNPLLKEHLIEMPGGSLRVKWEGPLQPVLIGPAQFEFDLSFPSGVTV